jgi:hypothetical protein
MSTGQGVAMHTDLIERYLQAVRFLLPRKQRDDVGRELAEDLRAQVEEKEAELGRRLTEDETAAILKGVGHPLLLALRYQQGRSLIGPEVFPLFWFAVKSILGVLAAVHIVLPMAAFLLSGEPSRRVVGLFLRFPGVAVQVLGWVTIGFVVLDTTVVRSAIKGALASWRPQDLGDVEKVDEAAQPPSSSGLAWTAFLSVWWLAGIAYPPLLLGPMAAYVDLGPVFQRLYVPIAASAVASVAGGWLQLAHRRHTRLVVYVGIVADVLVLTIFYLMARERVFVVPASPAADPGLVFTVNAAVRLTMQVGFVAAGAGIAWKYVKHFRGRRGA